MLTITSEQHFAAACDGFQVANEQPQTEFLRLPPLDELSSARRETDTTGYHSVEISPVSQLTKSTSTRQGLSRRSTEPVIDVASSSSSLPTLSFSSASSCTDIGDQKLSRILATVQEIADDCRICWVHRETKRPHRTFRCTTKICSDHNWNRFKVGLQFPKNVVCYFCLSPYGPPFNHTRSSPGIRPSAELCEYPDVLKELIYILYQDEAL